MYHVYLIVTYFLRDVVFRDFLNDKKNREIKELQKGFAKINHAKFNALLYNSLIDANVTFTT